MVDKIGRTEPLDSERGALEIVMRRSCRRAQWVAAVDELRSRMGIVTGARGVVRGRNHYDRCGFEGQRRGRHECGRGGPEGVNRGAHGGGRGGARAVDMLGNSVG